MNRSCQILAVRAGMRWSMVAATPAGLRAPCCSRSNCLRRLYVAVAQCRDGNEAIRVRGIRVDWSTLMSDLLASGGGAVL